MAGVTILQLMEKAPDRKAVEQVKLNLGWITRWTALHA
ncbi:MAG: hypothetical protein EHM61_08505 [Acidobacteria bacterium]|nr:MAG: hypothetical protein EHM61_08505 [Acidobacteriota bacterium]